MGGRQRAVENPRGVVNVQTRSGRDPVRTGSVPGQENSRINNIVKTSRSLEPGIYYPEMDPTQTGNAHV